MLEENTCCEQVCDHYFNPQKYQKNCPKQNSDLPLTSTSWCGKDFARNFFLWAIISSQSFGFDTLGF